MSLNKIISVSMWAAYLCVLGGLTTPMQLAAQQDRQHRGTHNKYKLIDLGTFGGPGSQFSDGNPPLTKILNNRGVGAGTADISVPDPYSPNCITDCFVSHGFQEKNGVLTDLGALPGVNTSYPFAINEHDLFVGISENGTTDPLTGFPELDPVLWIHDKIHNLGTFGGSQGVALGINNRGQVVGGALNAIPDPFASEFDSSSIFLFPGTTEARGFLWQDGVMKDLGTLGGPDSVASYVNDRGQVTGISYTSATANAGTGVPTADPFLWECGRMLDLGSLGGTFGNPSALNERGQVAGTSNLAGDQTHHPFLWTSPGPMRDLGTLGGNNGVAFWANEEEEVVGLSDLPGSGTQLHHGFLWRRGAMIDLGTVDGDPCSIAMSINSRGQIVGTSTNCTDYLHGFISENGEPAIDLNSLVQPGSGLTIMEGTFINARGEIAGRGLLSNGDIHAVLLIPCDSDHPGVEDCDYDPADLNALAASARANTASSTTTGIQPRPRGSLTRSTTKP